jgi:septal ring factor EnvC (AmiA/AmiB activator)
MKVSKAIAVLALFFYIAPGLASAAEDPILAEIEKNIAETKKKMEAAQDTTKDLEKSIEKAQKNLSNLNSAIAKREAVKDRSSQLLTDYNSRIGEAERARKEFQAAIEKDRKELALVRKDIVMIKQKLGALEAAEKALNESIQVSEEGLDKISNSRTKWGQNKGDADSELQEVTTDLESLKKQRDEQQKIFNENTASLQKWRQNYVQLAKTLQDLTLRLKNLQQKN